MGGIETCRDETEASGDELQVTIIKSNHHDELATKEALQPEAMRGPSQLDPAVVEPRSEGSVCRQE